MILVVLLFVLFILCSLYITYEEKSFKLKVKLKNVLHMKYNPKKYSYEEFFNKNKFITEYTFKWKDIIIVMHSPCYLSPMPNKADYFKKYIYDTFSMIAKK